jgi:hypothetical protein
LDFRQIAPLVPSRIPGKNARRADSFPGRRRNSAHSRASGNPGLICTGSPPEFVLGPGEGWTRGPGGATRLDPQQKLPLQKIVARRSSAAVEKFPPTRRAANARNGFPLFPFR